MPSLLTNYEYDIFVSYRHKDNGERWVTDFVEALRTELAATFKEEISIYFDSNAYDGLLETHNVDKSLEHKLKSLVFLPILSRTYCDPKSFAWRNEFCTFNKLARDDSFGRDIKLRNGNYASRILPICIHELDPEDVLLIEEEISSRLRSIDFTFRSAGVNRALRKDDLREMNSKRLSFRDQINRVANAANEIITCMQNRGKTFAAASYGHSVSDEQAFEQNITPATLKNNPSRAKSIAVLPFVSLARDTSQDYFSDGITENILMQLGSIRQLRVTSRTSIMRYKNTTKSAPEIAAELGVKYLLEGSVQTHGNKVKINVQLINAEEDENVWSKVFLESLDDIFSIQNHVAEAVASELKSSFQEEEVPIKEIPTKNLEAFDLFLRGRHAFNQWSVEGYRTATNYFLQAIGLDPEFKQAYSYLASSYSARMSWNGDLKPNDALNHIDRYLNEAWKRGPSDNDYLTKAFVEFFIHKNFETSEKLLLTASEINPNNASVQYTYSYVLAIMGRFKEALALINKTKKIEPHSVAYFNYKGICLFLMGEYDDAVVVFEEGLRMFPTVLRFYDHLSKVFLARREYDQALKTLNNGLHIANIRPPSMVAYMAYAYRGLNDPARAEALLAELLERSENHEKGVNYYVALVYHALGNAALANTWIKKAEATNDVDLIWRNIDPLTKGLKPAAVDFESAIEWIYEKQVAELPADLYYHNLDHIKDVVESAERIARNENVSEEDIELIKVAAWFHDSGFTVSPKDHEQTGCVIAREALPKYGFDEDQIEMICGMIMATKIPQRPNTQMERIICDADLDYLGRDDFFSIGARLFEEMKGHGFVESEREWNLIQKTFLENHRYHTGYNQQTREVPKQKHLNEIVGQLKKGSA